MLPLTIEQALREAQQKYYAGARREAEGILRNLLSQDPRQPDALLLLGLLAHEAGNANEAVDLIRRAIEINPIHPAYHGNLGFVYKAMGRLEETIAAFRRAAELRPDLPEAHFNLGAALDEAGRWQQSVAAYRAALNLRTDFPEALEHLGSALLQSAQPSEAVRPLQRAIALRPSNPKSHYNLGVAHMQQGHLDEAIACYRRALALWPQYGDAAWNLGLTYLQSGDFRQGWPLYESRLWRNDFVRREFSQPMWDGSALGGKRILLYAEQGFGDVIWMSRLAATVHDRGGRVILECQPELKPLLTNLPGTELVIAQGEPIPNFDVHLPLMSVPGRLGITLQTIPSHVPYMRPDPARAERWRRRLAGESRLKVGLVWASRPHPPGRSIEPKLLSPLRHVPGVRLYSLQKFERERERESRKNWTSWTAGRNCRISRIRPRCC